MTLLIIGIVAFLGVHVLPAISDLRARLVETLGENGYKALFSLLSIIGFVLIVWGFARAPFIQIWTPPHWTRYVAMVLMLPVFVLILAAYLPGEIKARVKHPFLVAIKTWALAHLIANGDLASIILFGGLAALALGGARAIDARREREDPSGFARIAAVTSNLPLAALISQRQRLRFADLGLWRILIAAIVYVVLFHAHRWVAGVALT